METTYEQYANFGQAVAGVMDGYYALETPAPGAVIAAIEILGPALGVEFKRP